MLHIVMIITVFAIWLIKLIRQNRHSNRVLYFGDIPSLFMHSILWPIGAFILLVELIALIVLRWDIGIPRIIKYNKGRPC